MKCDKCKEEFAENEIATQISFGRIENGEYERYEEIETLHEGCYS